MSARDTERHDALVRTIAHRLPALSLEALLQLDARLSDLERKRHVKPVAKSAEAHRCSVCDVSGHNARTCPQRAGAPVEHDERDAVVAPPASRHLRPLPFALRKLEARRIVDEANPVNPRGTLPTPLSTWVI